MLVTNSDTSKLVAVSGTRAMGVSIGEALLTLEFYFWNLPCLNADTDTTCIFTNTNTNTNTDEYEY